MSEELIQAAIGDPIVYEKVKKLKGYGKKANKAKKSIIVINGTHIEKVKCKIINDHWLEFKCSLGKRKVLIATPPSTYEYKGLFHKKRELCWYVGAMAEATHDPGRCQYDIPVLEAIIKLAKAVTDTEIPATLSLHVKAKKLLQDILPYIIIGVVACVPWIAMNW